MTLEHISCVIDTKSSDNPPFYPARLVGIFLESPSVAHKSGKCSPSWVLGLSPLGPDDDRLNRFVEILVYREDSMAINPKSVVASLWGEYVEHFSVVMERETGIIPADALTALSACAEWSTMPALIRNYLKRLTSPRHRSRKFFIELARRY